MKRLREAVMLAGSIVVLTAIFSCSSPGNNESSRPAPAATPSEKTTGNERQVWEWTLGRSWDDPALSSYTADLTQDGTYAAAVRLDDGFKLLFDPSSGRCTEVLLVNDEESLGFPPGNLFQAYTGRLPGGLNWRMTGPEVLDRLGKPDASYTAGNGVELTFTWHDVDGYGLVVSSAARHQKDFSTALMHDIQVTQPR